MAFKQNPNKKARLEDLSKTALVKTVKTLQRRETKLLNQVAKLERIAAGRSPLNPNYNRGADLLVAVEFGYRAGEKGADNLEATLHKWQHPTVHDVSDFVLSGAQLDSTRRTVPPSPPLFPWEEVPAPYKRDRGVKS